MMVIALVPVIMAVVGALVFLLPFKNPKVTEIGRCVMFAGLLALALALTKSSVRIGAAELVPSAAVEWAASDAAPSLLRAS